MTDDLLRRLREEIVISKLEGGIGAVALFLWLQDKHWRGRRYELSCIRH